MAKHLYIQAGTLIDGNGAAPVPNPGILVSNGKIAAVGKQDEQKLAALRQEGLTDIDATGKYVMPGLIDGHCHISSSQVTFRDTRKPRGFHQYTPA